MKKTGIVGGLGPASTLDYYNDIISGYRKKMQTEQYPEIMINSINMTEMLGYLQNREYEKLIQMLNSAVEILYRAGADFAVIASNTPHIVFEEVSKNAKIPMISIIEATCAFARKQNFKKVLVLGTMFTMSNGVYTSALERYGIVGVIPNEENKKMIHNIIFPKLEDGIVVPEDKAKLVNYIEKMAENREIDAVILGCTELPLMIKQEDLALPVLNTAAIHIDAVIEELLTI